jgi:hypothetical protein
MSRRDSLGIAAQYDWGQPMSTIEFYAPVESVDVSHNDETIEIEETTGTRFPSRIEKGTRYGELSVSGAVRSESFGRILYATFGEPTTVATADPAFVHTFDPAAADAQPLPVSLLVSRVDPDPGIIDLFDDCIVNSLTMNCEPNGYLSYSATFVAKDYESKAAPSPTFDFSERYPFHRLTAYISVDGGAEEEIPLGSWSMEYNNNIPTDAFVLGQRVLWELVEDNADCSVSFSPRTKLNEHHRRALADTPEAVKLRLEAVGSDIGVGSVPDGEFRVEVILHLIEYTDAPASINAGERMNMIEISARAAYDDDAGKFIDVILENETEDYDQPVS